MEKTIYALLVGIDDYPSPVPRLNGCVNDLDELRQYLEARVDPDGRQLTDALKIKTLVNREATRDAVIRGFREHLCQAGPEDVILFAYSGHGSQEKAPEQFWAIEPDHLDETLVLHDSRTDGSWDLADKELAKLINEVSGSGAHVVVLLDCCHSGSGTRSLGLAETTVRRAPTDLRQRPIESFIFASEELPQLGSTRSLGASSSGWAVTGRHVLLAACRDDEEAKEYRGGGKSRGAFSYFLGETLRTTGGTITYRDLFARAAALVQAQVKQQSPQLEASDSNDLLRPFLGGAIRQRARTFTVTHGNGIWTIDGGRMHGIPGSAADGATEVTLFAYNTVDDDLGDPAKSCGKARIARVFGATSELEPIDSEIDPAISPLKAVITKIAVPRMRVSLEGDPAGTALVQEALAISQFVRLAANEEGADYRLIARGKQYLIAKPDDDRPLVAEIDGYTKASADKVVKRLEHIERWKASMELDNPASSIGADEIAVEILKDGRVLEGSELRLAYERGDGNEWVSPKITIRLTNKGQRTLYVGLLDLPQTFGIFNVLDDVGHQKLDPNKATFARSGTAMSVTVPDKFWVLGISEMKETFKIIVSTTPFDARLMVQDDLDVPRVAAARTRGTKGLAAPGSLERLMKQIQTRHIGEEAPRRIDDWRAIQYTLTTYRPLPAQPLQSGRGLSLMGQVRVEPHPSLTAAEVRLTSMPVATRAVGAVASLPRLLHEDTAVSQALNLVPSRSIDAVNVLELADVNSPGLVTAENPLRITIPQPLAPGELVLPVAFDGEFFLPLGRAEPSDGKIQVILERLPAPTPAQSRSLGGSLRILFQKVASRTFGTAYAYPILAIADVGPDLVVRYEADAAVIKQRVAAAKRIVLFVHGIIGDTRDMAASIARAGIKGYDLILTYDYENLQDSIVKTARTLKDRLEAVGLGASHSKSLDVVAHSMGGLVSRWFIEREDGHKVVNRLVMLGTPNGGSPWPSVVDWATTALAVGLNELSKVAWPATALAGLTKAATSAAQVTLGEMEPESDFLKNLSLSPDPKTPYVIIGGNTSLIPSSAMGDERRTKLQRLLHRLWPEEAKYKLANLVFDSPGNDIAVALQSMKNLPGRNSAGALTAVACDHITYFQDKQSLQRLSEALG